MRGAPRGAPFSSAMLGLGQRPKATAAQQPCARGARGRLWLESSLPASCRPKETDANQDPASCRPKDTVASASTRPPLLSGFGACASERRERGSQRRASLGGSAAARPLPRELLRQGCCFSPPAAGLG
jgi:hypothetical protein